MFENGKPTAQRTAGFILVGCLLCVFAPGAYTAWQAQLDNGNSISVDPASNRTTISSGQAAGRQLWDGVHRLSDGSTITIRSGVMVPNEQSLAPAPALPPIQAAEPRLAQPYRQSDTTCRQLVLKNCGMHGECRQTESCCLAQQLRSLQRKAQSSDPGGYEWAIGQCQQALEDERNFPTCETSAGVLAAPCR